MSIAHNPVVIPFIEIFYPIPIPLQAFPSICQISHAALPEVPKLTGAKHVLAGLEGVWGHCSSASVLHVEKCALVLKKRSTVGAGGSWDPWHLPEGPQGWRGDCMPGVMFVQPFAHLRDTATATTGCLPRLFSSLWVQLFCICKVEWAACSFCTRCSFGGFSLICVFKCRLCFAKGTLLSLNGIIHLNTWFGFYTRKSDEIRADIFSSSG